ncbi:MAG: gliding motility-associated C-terminal domain-containing protein [Bacteroidia bacterium]
MSQISYISFVLLCVLSFQLNAQLEFDMADTTVTECKGILYDSGGDGVDYLHNSNLTFTICLDAPGTLTMAFEFFCVEVGFDSLTFHAGPDETYPQIGPAYSGTDPPPAVSISSGCLTLHFVSDANVACTGWLAQWTTEVVPPIPPQITAIIPVPACSSSTAIVNLSKPLHCDSIYTSAFELDGPLPQGITSANPINCLGDSATSISLTFAEGINLGGLYTLSLTTNYLDACDSLWTFITEDDFNVVDCPIVVTLLPARDSICFGECVEIIAEVTGGDGNYTYYWSGITASGPGPIQACLNSTSTITLTVDDTSPAVASSGSVSIFVAAPASVPTASTVCQSEPPFLLNASPAGGEWLGNGITDSETGQFTGDSAMAGVNVIGYVYEVSPTLTCTTATQITILPINAGFAQAACPGSDAFQIFGFTPAGGVWSGPQVSNSGIFDPSTEGEYLITYSVNGCSEDITVYVDDIENVPVFTDTLCQSDASVTFPLSPPGGRWYGEGIVDSLLGTFDPGEVDAGLITLEYRLNGCSQDVEVYVKEIWAGWNSTACPTQEPYALENFAPNGGSWSGDGVSITGTFDPGFNNGNGFNTDLIYSHPNGCTDTSRIFVFYTNIGAENQVFCSGDEGIELNRDNFDTDPWEGLWSGAGVVDGDDPDLSYFDASLAGSGVHLLVFEQNTCADSIYFIVQQSFAADLPGICEQAPPIDIPIPDYAAGGEFAGDGIADSEVALFDPSLAGEGMASIFYQSPDGCRDTIEVSVEDFREVEIGGPGGILCFVDSLYPIELSPTAANVFGLGYVAPLSFNPVVAGEGEHWLYAEIGSGFCQSRDSVLITVGPAIGYSLFVSKDTLCFGEFTSVLVNAYGGSGGLISYIWSNDLPPLQQHILSPQQSTDYTLRITDGCSLLKDTVSIVVQDRIDFEVFLSEPACYGEEASAEIGGVHGGEYEISWRGDTYGMQTPLPGQSSFSYTASVKDTATGCAVDTIISLPGYPLVQAEFSINPALECIPFDVEEVNFIDLSTGGAFGTWSFGDGEEIEYIEGQNPNHDYQTHGEYTVELSIADSNGCDSKTTRTICLREPFRVYLPTAVTLNQDGLNETFRAWGEGVLNIDLYIYDRRGVEIFHGQGLEDAWDGMYEGSLVQSGIFAWIVEVQWVDKQWFTKSGTVTVLR